MLNETRQKIRSGADPMHQAITMPTHQAVSATRTRLIRVNQSTEGASGASRPSTIASSG